MTSVTIIILTVLIGFGTSAVFHFLAHQSYGLSIVAGLLTGALTLVASVVVYRQQRPNYQCPPEIGEIRAGVLAPADNDCLRLQKLLNKPPFPEATKFFHFGSSVVRIDPTVQVPTNVIQLKNRSVLSIDQTGDTLRVTTDLYSPAGVAVAQIVENHVEVAASGNLSCKRPDLSTLEVTDDKQKKELLFIKFWNPENLEIRGYWKFPGTEPIEITQHRLHGPGGITMIGGCYQAAGPGVLYFQ